MIYILVALLLVSLITNFILGLRLLTVVILGMAAIVLDLPPEGRAANVDN
jgi:hypothetical protein